MVHVVIFIGPQPSAKNYARLLSGKICVFCVQSLVLFVVDGIIRLVTRFPGGGILAGNHRLFLSAELEMLMLDYAGERNFRRRIIHDRIPLKVGRIQNLRLKTERAVFQRSVAIIEKSVHGARIDNFSGTAPQIIRPVVEKVRITANFRAFQHLFDDFRITADGIP